MSKVRDPRLVGGGVPANRGGLSGEQMALEQMQIENAIKGNPLFPMVAEIKQHNKHLMAQNRSLTIKLQALMDYLAHVGLLLHQDLDDDGFPSGEPYSPDYKLFEALAESSAVDIELPTYGFTTYYIEHEKRTVFLIEMMTQLQQGIKTMVEVLDMVRNFNTEPGRIVPIAGVEFGLDGYLTHNPDNLPEEECEAIAAEFGLAKSETEEDTDVDTTGESEEGEQGEVVPFDQGGTEEGEDAR
jgi:hypothetical protein